MYYQNIILSISIASWLYMMIFWGRQNVISSEPFFWTNKIIFSPRKKKLNNINEWVAVIVPARNEELHIEESLKSIILQKNINFKIFLIDDNSTDKTKLKAANLFKKLNFVNYQIINGRKLRNNWSGKLWAMQQGLVQAIKENKFEYILFLDADIKLKENLIRGLLDKIKKEKLIMISLMAKLNCKYFWEKLLIPAFIFFFQKLYPFNLVNNSQSKFAAAAGGCIFSNINIFKKKNILEGIKNKIIDDCNLAKILKKEGKIWLGLTDHVESLREYKKLDQIWRMVSRTAYEQLNNSIIILLTSIFGIILMYLVSSFFFIQNFLIFQFGNIFFISLNFFLISLAFRPTIKFYNLNVIFSLFLPISAFFYMLMTISSAFNYYFKTGNIWKDRIYK